jgi:hypothetical protein
MDEIRQRVGSSLGAPDADTAEDTVVASMS